MGMPIPLSSVAPTGEVINPITGESIKMENEENAHSDQYMDILMKAVQRRKVQMKAQRTFGNANRVPAAKVQQPWPPTPPASSNRAWAKRPAPGPPHGFSGVRQQPRKQHQAQPPPRQTVPHAWRPAPNAHRAAGTPPTAANTRKPPFHPRSTPQPAAAPNIPPVVCGVCDVRCATAYNLRQHEQGKKHQNKVACAAGKASVHCEVCDVYLSGELNVAQHYAGKKHRWQQALHRGASGSN